MIANLERVGIFSLAFISFFASISLIYILTTEELFFLFKENSIKFLPDQSYSKELPDNWVSIYELPKGSETILINIEDKKYYNHQGYSLYDIHSALFHNFFLEKKLRGASTITQQLARTLFLNREKTIKRKLTEIRIAVALERSLNKKEILEYYLNTVYWGRGFNGIYFASKYHFQKSPKDLNLDEFRELVQKLKRPDHK
ncbi:biosynthetic peptidoglycan transglycosylase [Leptospira sp. GIMC2001]|uniref:biosynthetic peptidoglycan transglycosylase n=1 Tax=Leptospira sp. GIMC2001 TaxID=1513297 RepID=UPI0023490793|nr:biosynthetic peptidoglycan transglycosylase [Leptospira sp. GIMC2001]WCL49294.1 transglycosylase domain-containing protein [Leptospira sp. GIMC2001]